MTAGRTLALYKRAYIGGYDLSAHMRNFGPHSWTFEEFMDDAVTLSVKGGLLGQATIGPGTLNGIFDNTAVSGIHIVLPTAGGMRNIMLPQGIAAAPAAGDPVFCGQFPQLAYQVGAEGLVPATIPFGKTHAATTLGNYAVPWGRLLHAKGAETAVNSGAGVDNLGGETTKGGYMMYQVFTAVGNGDIRATIKVQDCDTSGGVYNDLLSTGVINLGSGGTAVPTSGVVALANSAHVQEFTRWQLVFSVVGGHECTSVTFALALVRGIH